MFGVLVGVAERAAAQVNRRDVPLVAQPQQRFSRGQDIQPIFEGWTRNEDGTYDGSQDENWLVNCADDPERPDPETQCAAADAVADTLPHFGDVFRAFHGCGGLPPAVDPPAEGDAASNITNPEVTASVGAHRR